MSVAVKVDGLVKNYGTKKTVVNAVKAVSFDVQQYPRGMYMVSVESANGEIVSHMLMIAR